MSETIRLGVTYSEIKVATKELRKHGLYQDYQPSGRMSHGMGMLITEPPSLNSTDNTVLEPGLVFSTEPQAFGEGLRIVYEDVW